MHMNEFKVKKTIGALKDILDLFTDATILNAGDVQYTDEQKADIKSFLERIHKKYVEILRILH